MPSSRSIQLAALGSAATVLALVAASLPGASAAPPEPSGASPAAAQASAPTGGDETSITVTLVTGDRVTLVTYPDGTSTAAVQAAPRPDGAPVVFHQADVGDGVYVVPSDAGPLLGSDVLDRALFEVGALAAAAAASPDTGAVPLLLAYGDDVTPAVLTERAAALAGAVPGIALDSIDAVAVGVPAADASAFWSALQDEVATGRSDAVAKVWLDAAVEVSLDQSVPQIGGDLAWAAGFDGTGVTIAVLDTGLDLDHPDFAGRVTDTENFTSDPIEDGHGHGTHVASIAAGSGAASDGRYIGVAPGADLLIGKVLPDSGTGPESAVIAGMEWAAEAGADVINLSLGSAPTDGTDPASQAVDELSAETGALFVIATGNDYSDAYVQSPAAATSALAVGAVDKSDSLADYSNRGPRRGDAAVKPELTAPGTDIVAARADSGSLGEPVDNDYTRASGTSMATPHVAGSAALLAQRYPDWDWAQLKDGLVSTAAAGAYTEFQGGAGRVDAAAAVLQGVYGTATASFGAILPPYEGIRARELTYTNTTDADVTLNLVVTGHGWDGRELPVGAVSLSADTLTVPGGGTATLTLSLDPELGERGAYIGLVDATAVDGVEVRTPFSYYKTTASLDLDVHTVDHRGAPAYGQPIFVLKTDGAFPNDPFFQLTQFAFSDEQGNASFEVTAGTYDVYGSSTVWDIDSRRITQMIAPEVEIESDASVELDGRDGVLVNPQLPEDGDVRAGRVGYMRGFAAEGDFAYASLLSDQDWEMAVQPAGPVADGWLEVAGQWSISSQPVSLDALPAGGEAYALDPEYFSFYSAPRLAGDRTLRAVFAGGGTPEELADAGVEDAAAVVAIDIPDGEPYPASYAFIYAEQVAVDALAAGAAAVITYVDEVGAIAIEQQQSQQIIQLSVPVDQGRQLRADLADGEVDLSIKGSLSPDRLYQLRFQDDVALEDYPPVVDLDDLVAIDTEYHADRPGSAQQMFSYAFTPTEEFGSTVATYAWSPAAWTEYVLAGTDLRWDRTVTPTGWPDTYQPGVQLRSREIFTVGVEPRLERWNQSPIRSGAADVTDRSWASLVCSSCRHGDWFVPGLYTLDSARRHFARSNGATTEYRLFHDAVEIPAEGTTFKRFPLPPEPGTYTLEAVWSNPGNPELNILGRTIETTWTFASEVPGSGSPEGYECPITGLESGCAFQPLVELDYALKLGLANQARLRADGTQRFRVRVAPHSTVVDPARAAGFELAYSVDGGATWTDATTELLRPRRGAFRVTLEPSGGDGYVWLQAAGWDADGNRVEQTIQRAYRLPAG